MKTGSGWPAVNRPRGRKNHFLCRSALLGSLLLLLASPSAQAQRRPDVIRSVSTILGAQGRIMWVDGTANLTRKVKVNGKEELADFTTTRAGVQEIVRKCKAAGVNTLVVDVKPLSGEVLYKSKIAPRMRSWKGRPVPDFDVLAAFVEEGHKAGLQVHACINTLSEGHKYFSVGPAYQKTDWQSVVYAVDRGLISSSGARLSVRVPGESDDPNKPAILNERILHGAEETGAQVGLEGLNNENGGVKNNVPLGQQLNLVLDGGSRAIGIVDSALLGDDPLAAPDDGRLVTASRAPDRAWIAQNVKPGDSLRFDFRTVRLPIAQAPGERVAVFVNPLHPEARRYLLDIVREIVTNYAIDGFVLDRCRFSNLNNDFSDRSREAFARWLGKPVSRWPEDIFAFSPVPGEKPARGPFFKPWLEFRAQTIRDLVADIARAAKSIKPNLQLGTYVGSWYPSYHEVGVNWGSEKTHLRYPTYTQDYPLTGYADFFDWITTGCYYPVASKEEARREGRSEKATVEYAAELSSMAVAGSAFVYGGIFVSDYANDPERFLRALEAASRYSQGWMIFDLVYIEEYGWWPHLERAYAKQAVPPVAHPGLLSAVRAAMDGVY